MVQVYYGLGKGKTTCAVGAAIRMAGAGKKVLFLQFFKNGSSSECNILKSLDNIYFFVPDEKYQLFKNITSKKQELLKNSYNNLLNNINKNYDMVVLDEILDAVKLNIITIKTVEDLFFNFKNTEFVLTGHQKIPEIFEQSDYITEFKEEKHPFKKGIFARKGIEY